MVKLIGKINLLNNCMQYTFHANARTRLKAGARAQLYVCEQDTFAGSRHSGPEC